MWLPIVALLAVAEFALANSPASTYCYEDNLLRAFQHTPTPASKYCVTDTGYPTFLSVTSYPPSRLSSACSCFSRFPTEPSSAPSCTPTSFAFNQVGVIAQTHLNILVTINRNMPCASGFAVTSICGTYAGNAVALATSAYPTDNCYQPDAAMVLATDDFLVFSANGVQYDLRESLGVGTKLFAVVQGAFAQDEYNGDFTDAPCGTACPT